jgi:hypothetical protein
LHGIIADTDADRWRGIRTRGYSGGTKYRTDVFNNCHGQSNFSLSHKGLSD